MNADDCEKKDYSRKVDEKEIIKVWSNANISKAVFDWNITTAPVTNTFTSHAIFRYKGKDYIGVEESLLKGEVIEVGLRRFKYKVIGNTELLKDLRRVNRVSRLDGYSMTNIDVENSKQGAKVRINRVSGDEVLELMNKI